MGRKTEYRLINEIETTSTSVLIPESTKQKTIIKNVKFLRKYGHTKSYWYGCVLPLILKRHNITRKLTVKS